MAPCSNGVTIFRIVGLAVAYPSRQPTSCTKRWKNSGS